MDTIPFYIALFIHLIGLILAFGSVLVTDLFGLLWVLDRMHFPQVVKISHVTEKYIWTGWGIMVAAGIPLILLKGEVDNLMIIKLFFVFLIAVNGAFLYKIHKKLQNYNKSEHVPKIIMFRLGLTLFISQVSWWCAIVIGFVHRHIEPIIQWPNSPWFVCVFIVFLLIVVWLAGEHWITGTDEKKKRR